MALACAASEGVIRTTGVIAASSDYTCVGWLKAGTPGGGQGRVVWATVDSTASYQQWIAIYALSGAPNSLFLSIGTGGVEVAATTPTAIQLNGQTGFIYVRSGTTHTLYVNGGSIGALTQNVAAYTLGAVMLGNDTGPTAPEDAQYFREWNSALTLAQGLAELNSPTPIVTSGLKTDTPLVDDLLDTTANNNDWTPLGSPTFVDGPIPKPITNLTGATAYDLGDLSGAGFVQVVRLSTGVTEDTWWTYTAPVGTAPTFSWWAFGEIGVYNVLTNIYEDAGGATVYNSMFNYAQKPIMVPVTGAGQQLWLRAVPNAGNPRAALWVRTQAFSNTTPPSGSILINDAATGFPAALTSEPVGTAGLTTPLQYRDLPGGEQMVATEDGTIFLQDLGNTTYKIFDSSFAEVATVGNYSTNAIGTNRTTLFYQSDTTTLRAYTRTGALSASYGPLAATPARVAPARDDSLVYYVAGAANSAIKRWTLATNSAASDLAAGVAGYTAVAMIVLDDGTILVAYKATSGSPPDVFVRHYSAAGATVLDYTTQLDESSGADTHLAHALDDPTSFWVWIKVAGGRSSFINLRTSDGTVLKQAYGRHFTAGSWDGTVTDDPDQLFGHSESCQFLILGNPTPEPSIFTIEERIPLRIRRAPHLSDEQGWIFYKSIQYDFEQGHAPVTGQGSEPVCEHLWSNDGGHTWSTKHQLPLGKTGKYGFRTIGRNMGRSRDRVYEVRLSDPVRTALQAAYLEIEKGNS